MMSSLEKLDRRRGCLDGGGFTEAKIEEASSLELREDNLLDGMEEGLGGGRGIVGGTGS